MKRILCLLCCALLLTGCGDPDADLGKKYHMAGTLCPSAAI